MMDEKTKRLIEGIVNDQDKSRINGFVQQELCVYIKELDLLIALIKKDENVQVKNALRLKVINDSIIKDIESISRNLIDKRSVKVLGNIFRESRPLYYYASEIMDKGFKKYRGYPGDFEMMRYVYNNEPCSIGIIGEYFDKYFLDNAYAEAVRGRKNKMVNILDHFIKSSKKNSLEILNLPCGPARDVKDLIESKSVRSDIDIKITCVDQDDDALVFAKDSMNNKNKNLSIVFKKGNILNYVRKMDKYVDEMGQYDLVYSIGLADYLPDKLLQNMILFSFKLLKPRGVMTYAFKIADKDPFAPLPPKWFCDWQFVSRNLDEAWEVIKKSGIEGYEIRSEEWEESGRIAFLTIEKM